MGERENRLRAELQLAGYGLHPLGHKKRSATTRLLPQDVRDEFISLYRRLGGVRDDTVFTAGLWEKIRCTDGLVIEADEALHFNRYRAMTLDLPWTQELPWADRYRRYSELHEDLCLRDGWGRPGMWASVSSDKMFGGSSARNDLSGLGPSRWKQRALYDAVRDAYALFTPDTALARVAIHDPIEGGTFQTALTSDRNMDPHELRVFIDARTVPGS